MSPRSVDAIGKKGDPSRLEDLMDELKLKALIQEAMDDQAALGEAKRSWAMYDKKLERLPQPNDAEVLTARIQDALDPEKDDPMGFDMERELRKWAKETADRRAGEETASTSEAHMRERMEAATASLERLVQFMRTGR